MNEEQLQRIEMGFAAATPLSVYDPHGNRALADIMVDLESRTIVPALIAEVRRLRAKLATVQVYARGIYGEVPPISFEDWYALVQSRCSRENLR